MLPSQWLTLASLSNFGHPCQTLATELYTVLNYICLCSFVSCKAKNELWLVSLQIPSFLFKFTLW